MKLYLDTEFNGHGGELVSLALAAEKGDHFYQELFIPNRIWHPWVHENVVPYLDSINSLSYEEFRKSLREYLRDRSRELIIYADWPADFEHLIQLMVGPTFDTSWMFPCTMKLVRVNTFPEKPHHALSDAIALMQACQDANL